MIVGERSVTIWSDKAQSFGFKTRIDVHEGEVKEMLQRIQLAQIA